MKGKKTVFYFILILFLYFLFSVVLFYVITSSDHTDEKRRSQALLLTESIYDAVESRLMGPVRMAQTMAKDSFMIEALRNESGYSEKEMEELAQNYLSQLRKVADYDAAFLVSEKSRKYYNYQGLTRMIDPETNPHDVWYPIFAESGQPYAIDVDTDEINSNVWTIFVNARIEDEHGGFRGVCGVGLVMSELQDLFIRYENEYNVKIDLVDSEGLVQADSRSVNIETVYLKDKILSDTTDYTYTGQGHDGYVITRYIDKLDWYLVVEDEGSGRFFSPQTLFLLIDLAIFLFLALIGGFLFLSTDRKLQKQTETEDQTDPVTGLNNRNYFREAYGERGLFNTTRYQSIAVFDIDFFEDIHDAKKGDEILSGIAEAAKRIFGERSQIFRWSGDEFIVFLEYSVEESYELCRKLCREAENGQHVTVSVGVTKVRLSDTIKKNYYRAAQGCFLVKEMGGNGVKRS